ncbi:MAG: type II toxin-antitoxin system HicA family toxin [Betaproteobacteria bacterium]|nr:type II toxin-antitoxin system HicA family toxin [Betaproteobacteria bacterium]
MSHKHENLLRAIFEGPVSGNVHWREVEAMLAHLGANVEPHHGASFRVVLNGVEGFLHRPHNSNTCSKQELRHVRDYLVSAGVGLPQGGKA